MSRTSFCTLLLDHVQICRFNIFTVFLGSTREASTYLRAECVSLWEEVSRVLCDLSTPFDVTIQIINDEGVQANLLQNRC